MWCHDLPPPDGVGWRGPDQMFAFVLIHVGDLLLQSTSGTWSGVGWGFHLCRLASVSRALRSGGEGVVFEQTCEARRGGLRYVGIRRGEVG